MIELSYLQGRTGNIPGTYKHLLIMRSCVHSDYGTNEVFLGFSIENAHDTINNFDSI